ncbi:MFS transporter [Legionella sp. CNM-4043-24]|uniref:MFS transporter n=1 Tax=Legionella sp. CNM-4043-24 TaxID=3421646 RepID=UPI00403A8489
MLPVTNPSKTSSLQRYTIWFVGVCFVLFQFFLQLSSGVVIQSIVQEMQLSALAAGLLGSSFYYVYTSLQIPVGFLFDLKSTRALLACSALVCSLGCALFAQSHSLLTLFSTRLIIGGGASFAFIGLSHLLRQHFPLNQFAFMIGLSETLGFLITMLGIISLGVLVQHWGWRSFINGAAIAGLLIAWLCWRIVPVDDKQQERPNLSQWRQFMVILRSGPIWINGVFVGLSFTVITVFGAMWAVPFIQTKLGCDLKNASILDSMLFLGGAISCPLFGYLAGRFKRRPIILTSCLSTALLIVLILFIPTKSAVLIGSLMFLIGLCCGAYMLAYSIANEQAPEGTLSTCTGFINTLAMLSAPIMQPAVGFILDRVSQNDAAFTLHAYQLALAIVPAGLVIAAGLSLLLPEGEQGQG